MLNGWGTALKPAYEPIVLARKPLAGTVQECLRYSALLRLPLSTSPMETQLRIEHVLDELALRHVADSQVGGAGRIRGISGGERRR